MKIGVILGSVRKIRNGERVAKWLMKTLPQYKEAEFILLDLKDFPLPFYDEVDSPDSLPNGYSHPVATEWAAKIAEMDGFILLIGEYNHGPVPVLLNAIDFLNNQLEKKPVSFVSYSTGAYAGVRSVQQWRPIILTMGAIPLSKAVHISFVEKTLDEHGNLLKDTYVHRLQLAVEQLFWWTKLLKTARAKS